jgi:hypothetical protein
VHLTAHYLFSLLFYYVLILLVSEESGASSGLYLSIIFIHLSIHLFLLGQMFGRTIKCCIAKDNGRTTEFIRRREYPDKSHCYECGVSIITFQ